MTTKLSAIANDIFYAWENKEYPNNTTPLSDSHRLAFILGFIQGYRFLNDNGEKHDENLLRTL